jgi:hypothetical protein
MTVSRARDTGFWSGDDESRAPRRRKSLPFRPRRVAAALAQKLPHPQPMTQQTAAGHPLTPLHAWLYGAGAVGAIDFLYATIFVLLRGRPWFRPWQSVAYSVLGADTYNYGYRSAALGVLLHFTVAACIAAVYMVASRWLPILRTQFMIGGVVFGAIAFFVMNLVVIPLTRIGRSGPIQWNAFNIGGLIIHALLLGPAAAYFASRAPGSNG